MMSVPAQWPDGTFDLIVLSEVVYYLDRADLAALVERIRTCLVPGGDVVLVHWLGETHYPLTGDEAVATSASDFADVVLTQRHEAYRLDVLRVRGRRWASFTFNGYVREASVDEFWIDPLSVDGNHAAIRACLNEFAVTVLIERKDRQPIT